MKYRDQYESIPVPSVHLNVGIHFATLRIHTLSERFKQMVARDLAVQHVNKSARFLNNWNAHLEHSKYVGQQTKRDLPSAFARNQERGGGIWTAEQVANLRKYLTYSPAKINV